MPALVEQESPSAIDLEDGYSQYRKIGGVLPIKRYNEFLEICESTPNHCSSQALKWASGMELVSGLKFAKEEISTFDRLSKIMRTEVTFDRIDVCNLGDKELMAEIIKMGGSSDRLTQFTQAFPIFNNRF